MNDNVSIKIKYLLFFILFPVILFSQNNLNADNKYRLAKIYEQNGEAEKAKQIYLELYSAQPWNQTYLADLNNIYIAQKDYQSSIELLSKKIQSAPKDLTSYGLLGSTFYIMGETEKAYQTWDSGISASMNSSPNVYRIMANYPIENRAYEKAIEYLKQGKSVSPDPLAFSFDLASLYTAVMNYEAATEEYCRILNLQKQQIEIIKSRISVYFERQDASDIVINVLRKYFEQNKNAEFTELLSYFLLMKKKYDESLDIIIQFDESVNGNGQQIVAFANQFLAENAFGTAEKAYRYALSKNNSSIIPGCKIGLAKSSEGKLNQKYFNKLSSYYSFSEIDTTGQKDFLDVIQVYKEISQSNPNSEIANEALFRAGNIYLYKLFKPELAEKYFEFISTKFPYSQFALDSKIKSTYCKIILGNFEAAKKDIDNYSKYPRMTSEKSALAKYYLAKINFWNGRFSLAQSILNEITNELDNTAANDALELLLVINFNKNDSLNLTKFAKADFYFEQRNFSAAETLLKEISANENLLMLSKMAKFDLAEIYLTNGNIPLGLALLQELSDEEMSFLNDKCAFLQGCIYYFVVVDMNEARKEFDSLLEKYPNSIYAGKARELINMIEEQNKEKL
jgi:tetratricopeptide (TPR) repeat protein